MNQVVSKIKEVPDIILFELIEEFNLLFSGSALSRRLTRLGLIYKKDVLSVCWRILDMQGNRTLLPSNEILFRRPFHETDDDTG